MESYESTTMRIGQVQPACALVQDLLPLYLEGEVSATSGDLIVEHLANCERCAGFMAGAQSVRGQLALERRARAAVGVAARPERQTVLRWRAALAAAAAFMICAVGGFASGLLGVGGEGPMIGLVMGSAALGALLLLARIVGPLTPQRLSHLGTSVGTGVLSGIVIGGSDGGGTALAGLVLAFVATFMVCAQIARTAATPANPNPTR